MKERGEQIKICWRASFQQPIGALNPLGAKLAAPIEVEVRRQAGIWKCFRPGTKAEMPIAGQPQASTLKKQIEGLLFEKRLSPWQALDMVANKPLVPAEFALDEQERAWRIKT